METKGECGADIRRRKPDSRNSETQDWDSLNSPLRLKRLRACLETTRGAAARDFGCGQGGEFRASPQRAVRNEPTPATDKRPAARRVFGEKAVWLRCSSVEDPPGIFSCVAPRHPAFSPKTAPLVVSKQALSDRGCPPDAQNHGSQFYL